MSEPRQHNPSGKGGKASRGAHDAVSIVEEVLRKAVSASASDVHFEPTGREMLVRFRLDGVLSTIETLPAVLAENIVARLKVLAGLLTYRNDLPQEGRLPLQGDLSDPRVTDCRLAVFPTIHGQRAVVRLFFEEPALAELDHLGFSPTNLAAMKQTASSTQGMLLLTGPAGSGKSTTLAAILRHTVKCFPGRSIVTLEDPVERRIAGVTQVQVSSRGAMTFPTALRSLLRQDPEVLMIGEIRDAETARIAIEAALTGHLLLSTMHSGSSAGALLRLLEMGIEAYQVTSSIVAVVNQRLVRRLCLHCRKKDEQSGAYKSAGCENCLGTGFRGRALVAEMVQMDGLLRKAIAAKADKDELESILARRGHMSLLQEGARLVRDGATTKEELDKAAGSSIEP